VLFWGESGDMNRNRLVELRERALKICAEANQFKQIYGKRSPEPSTLRPFFSESSSDHEKVSDATLDKIEACLNVLPIFYDTYHTLHDVLIGNDSVRDNADDYVGDYVYLSHPGR
jgi:hypothetical protein